ncbi:patatin-like phospholipase domain-containing protein 4 isoform X2 [Lampetra fluviatilis]
MVPLLGLSFAGSGFLGVYHLGAASALLRCGRRLLGAVDAYAGASAGALAAAVMVTAPHRIADCTEFSYKFAEEIRSQHLGALTPGFPFMQKLREGIESILPSDAHERAEGRLHVSITSARTRRNRLVSHFSSRDELMQVDSAWNEYLVWCLNINTRETKAAGRGAGYPPSCAVLGAHGGSLSMFVYTYCVYVSTYMHV